ncbi:TNT domain-containing protein [Serinibacter arcticus]|uniref:Large tegument protein n=1 Tax=Serinibacter arcticus TaxID=1655435 RepID=A0A4Z1E0T0_9MICO|nr:TNT domain-containing protein [Serinibacter arcticus]TGO05565.1 Large tegument protein [Serinibacter arcticus]
MEQAGHPDTASSAPVPGAIPPPPTRPAFPAAAPEPGIEAASAATRPAPLPSPAEQAVASAPEPSSAPVEPPPSAWARPVAPPTPVPAPDEATATAERPVFTEPDLDQTHVARSFMVPSEPVEPNEPEPVEPSEPGQPVEPEQPSDPTAAPADPHRTTLVAAVAHALRSAVDAAGRPWDSAHLEWSQAGTQHSGRTYLRSPEGEVVRLGLPDAAVAALAELRVQDATPDAGTWFSAHLTLTPGEGVEPDLTVERTERPYWNSPALGMVLPAGTAAPAPAVPSDEQWLADLTAFPRSTEHVPAWLQSSTAGPGAASAALRQRLTEAQYPADAVVLPTDAPSAPGSAPLEGALELRQTGAHRFSVGVRDYGVFEPFHTAGTEREAADWLWNLLVAPLPAATPVAAQDLQYRGHAYQGAYAQIFAQLAGGGGALLTTLPPGVALDRLGSLDGIFLFPWATPIPNRSLPPTASGPSTRLYQFVTTAPLHVEAEIVPPWFGQPGGSLRFRIAADGVGVRQLVTARALMEVRVAS